MQKIVLQNGLTFLYKHSQNNLTSFSIAFEAGANVENESEFGMAHIVEHMLYKGTKNRSEYEINKLSDEIFGMNNAMTNYPYAVYYGTCLSSDFELGFELYWDIIINSTFPKEGFKEELDIICEELKEWKDDLYQCCEDEMFKNAFHRRRIKELIIGKENYIRNVKLQQVIDFYNKYYTADNCVITVISSIDFEKVFSTVIKYFGNWDKNMNIKNSYIENNAAEIYEENTPGVYTMYKKDIMGSKIQYCFPIHNLNEEELKALTIFNSCFGVGTSSILYDEIRTKHGLVYDISTSIKYEKGIKIFKISLGTSKVNEEKAINLINKKIEEIKNSKNYFNKERIAKAAKSIRLKTSLDFEKSIVECVRLSVYEIMFRDRINPNKVKTNFDKQKNYVPFLHKTIRDLEKVNEKNILSVVNKVLVNPTIQIISLDNSAK